MPESPLSPTAARQTPASSLLSHTDGGGGGGGGRAAVNGDSCSGASVENWQELLQKQVFLAMMSPQQTQQLLSPDQLQVLIQHKQQALLLQQNLKEFYKQQQIQLLQQQSCNKIKKPPAQQLVFQQLLHLQQQQQHLQAHRLAPSAPSLSAALNPAEMQQIWKELKSEMAEEKTTVKTHQDFDKVRGGQASGLLSLSPHRAERSSNGDKAAARVLFGHGVCNWPGCESLCENISQFIKHLSSEHTLDDRSTAQCRVQMQVVQQLDLQLCKERKRLQAMMAHLYLPALDAPSPKSNSAADPRCPQLQPVTLANTSPCLRSQASPQPVDPVSSPSQVCEQESPTHTSPLGAVRRQDCPLVFSLSSENEYELYKNTEIRPPFTYATLIRQAITEASDTQLTLNEIYNWFTRTFAYFRSNAATWKNAVRHNLSLHKCFVRVENVKGAVWTVDEEEYQRRRSQRITGSPSLMKTVSSNFASGNSLHSTLQAALAETSLSGFKERGSRNVRSQTQKNEGAEKPKFSPQIQQQLYFEDEEVKVNVRECLLPILEPVGLQPDMTGSQEETSFDLK
ncbi:forkhead box protein P2 isoform X2 [Nothobranchius furzeri]|uniref:Forkhead box protein P2-like n=2 Tax=Nothobranchius furzeri TaxID=105023 RepID=A0A8C6NWR7_NOTFU